MQQLLVLISVLVVAVDAVPEGYNLPLPAGQQLPRGRCKNGEVLNVDGTCAIPKVTQNLFVFTAPQQQQTFGPPPQIPPPTIEHNILFIRAPEQSLGPEPIIVPPPRQQNIVYVLNKKATEAQRVIEVPAQPARSPEVFFINYNEGENPTLPGGIDFQTALTCSPSQGSLLLVAEDLLEAKACCW
nr:uncharacterized protein LOC128685221 [Cherax quadricarinatus]